MVKRKAGQERGIKKENTRLSPNAEQAEVEERCEYGGAGETPPLPSPPYLRPFEPVKGKDPIRLLYPTVLDRCGGGAGTGMEDGGGEREGGKRSRTDVEAGYRMGVGESEGMRGE